MVRGVFTADQHGNIAQLTKAVAYARANDAILILGGDITPHAQHTHMNAIKRQRDFLRTHLANAIAPLEGRVYLLMGNEDCKCNRDVFEDHDVRYFLHDLHGKRWSLGKEIDIVGYSCVPCTPWILKDWERVDHDQKLTHNATRAGKVTHNGEFYPATICSKTIAEELADDVYQPNHKKTIFVSHCPPYDTHADAAQEGRHFGSRSIRDYIERHQPLITLHGHLHECVDIKGHHMGRLGNACVVGVGNFPIGNEVALIDFDTDKPDEAKRLLL